MLSTEWQNYRRVQGTLWKWLLLIYLSGQCALFLYTLLIGGWILNQNTRESFHGPKQLIMVTKSEHHLYSTYSVAALWQIQILVPSCVIINQ